MKTEQNNSLWLGWIPRWFNIFLCVWYTRVFTSHILIHTSPYFLMWSVSGHSVLARLAGVSNPGIPLPPLLSWDYKYKPRCLIFFLWVLGIWTHVLILAKQTIHILKHLSSPMWHIIPWRFLYCLYWKMISLYFWMLIIFFFFYCSLWKTNQLHAIHILFSFLPSLPPAAHHYHHHFVRKLCLQVTK